MTDPLEVIAIGVAKRDPEDPLLEHLFVPVHDALLIARILQVRAKDTRQADARVQVTQQDCPTVRALALIIESHRDWLPRILTGKKGRLSCNLACHRDLFFR